VWFAVLVLVAGLVPPSFVAAADLTFTPVADAHVNSGSPSGNYGGLTTMKVREGSGSSADPAYRGYWRFTVTGLTGAPASVKLRLFVTDASASSQGVYPIANTTWTETGLTYSNAPPITGSPLVSRTTPAANAYVEFALPASAVAGNGPVAFAIKSAGTDSAIFATREVGATPPQLVVTPNAGPPPPTAEFTGSPTSGPVGQSVTFDSSASQGSGLTYAWSFGDGTTPPEASQANPVHQYTSAGTFAVALTVSNGNGSSTRTRPAYITIGDPPVASFTATPAAGTAPLSVAFDATGSTGANLTYAWNFGDPGSGAANTSTLQKPTHTYAAGSYQVALTVSNANGTSAAPPATISVAPPPSGGSIVVAPAADAQVYGSSVNTNYGSLATMRTRENSGTSGTYRSYVKFVVAGTGGSVTALKLRLFVTDETPNAQGVFAVPDTTWTETGLTWTNAPASVGTPLVSAPAPTANAYVEFNLPVTAIPGDGTYTFAIKGTATNSAIFRTKEATTNRPQLVVTLGAPPVGVPTAAFTSDRSTGQAPLAVQFTDQSTNGANAWSWDFGEPSSGSANVSTARNPSHLYSTVGPHTVTLVASNVNGPSAPATGTITVDPATPGDPVLVGAGDIADCTVTQDEATASLLDGIAGTVFTAGDNAYPDGSTADYRDCYGPTWGRHKARTVPVVGNHEYQTPGATGYYEYFGAAAGDPTKGYYSFDIGTWHAVILNSNCAIVSCAAGSVQETWLRADLSAHPATCTIAIWHHPRFSSGEHGDDASTQPFWAALHAAGADIIVNGHDHDYERFALQTAAGAADLNFGIREFVAGTGGKSLRAFVTTAVNSEVKNASSWGLLKLTLHASSYDYSFIPIAGQSFTDAGSGSCHGAPPSP
jgi:PKD repeat protein